MFAIWCVACRRRRASRSTSGVRRRRFQQRLRPVSRRSSWRKRNATEPRLREPFAAPAPPKPGRLEPLSADRYGVHFTADGEFRELLERVRGLAGHRLPSGDLMTLLKRGLEAYERELSKQRFALGSKPRRSRGAAPTPSAPDLSASDRSEPEPAKLAPQSAPNPHSNVKRRRHYPAEVARTVFLRDGKQCSYVSPDGRRCNARRCLELDHIDPYAVGGQCTVENLRLRCRAHNLPSPAADTRSVRGSRTAL